MDVVNRNTGDKATANVGWCISNSTQKNAVCHQLFI